MAPKKTPVEIKIHDDLCILLNHATGHSSTSLALATTTLHPVVEEIRDKAIKLRFRRDSPLAYKPGKDLWHEWIWVPKKALVDRWLPDDEGRRCVHCKLALWFRPGSYAASVIDRFASPSFIAA